MFNGCLRIYMFAGMLPDFLRCRDVDGVTGLQGYFWMYRVVRMLETLQGCADA